ncbi:putative u3 small nucleolar rna-associated protein 21 [Balamuthia mandrillaris]
MLSQGSQVFKGYRALGLVSDRIPFTLQHFGTETFVTVSIGKSFQTYNCKKLNLLFVGAAHESRIRAMVMYKLFTITAAGNFIYVWKRGALQSKWSAHTENVQLLSVFGDHLISVGGDGRLKLWDLSSLSKSGTAKQPLRPFTFLPSSQDQDNNKPKNNAKLQAQQESTEEINLGDSFHTTALLHPDTYLNKVLLGSEEGSLQLWNIKTRTLIYSFAGWGSPVTCLEQSPAVDVVAIGLADGRILLHNLRFDRTLVTFSQEGGKVTSLSFRKDGHPILASAMTSGRVALWDLEKKKLITIVKKVHSGPILRIAFFPDEPILLTSGIDNSIKMWLFDQPYAEPRLLRERSGHKSPPTKVRFYGDSGYYLLSCGVDRSLRFFCTVQDARSQEFSQGHIQKKAKRMRVSEESLKLRPIVDFAASSVKEREWDNVISCHEGSSHTQTWNLEHRAIGKHALHIKYGEHMPIKSVAISTCGNFGIAGTVGGPIHKFNLQSGRHRGSFIGHSAAIQGLAVDFLNKLLISASLDGTLKFWDFMAETLLDTLTVGSPITRIMLHKESSLLATASDDLVIRIFDVDTRRLVRRFEGHSNQITDIAFSPDARWLVTSSLDCTVCVWDLPSGMKVDWFRVEKAVTSLSFSPTGDFLATTHVNSRAIFMWANQMHFSRVFLQPVPETPPLLKLPKVLVPPSEELDAKSDGMLLVDVKTEEDEEEEGEGKEKEKDENSISPTTNGSSSKSSTTPSIPLPAGLAPPPETPLSNDIVTLSTLPRHRWETITNLDIIKKRNKPIEPPKKPEAAPFFLTTLPGLEPKFVAARKEDEEGEEDEDASSRIVSFSSIRPRPKLVVLLEKKQYVEAMEHLKGMSPSAVDVELRSLGFEEDVSDLHLMLDFFCHQLDSNTDFGISQAYLNLFLKIYADVLIQNKELAGKVQALKNKEKEGWTRLQHLFHNNICLIKFFQDLHA